MIKNESRPTDRPQHENNPERDALPVTKDSLSKKDPESRSQLKTSGKSDSKDKQKNNATPNDREDTNTLPDIVTTAPSEIFGDEINDIHEVAFS